MLDQPMALLLAVAAAAAAASAAPLPPPPPGLAAALSAEGLVAHLEALRERYEMAGDRRVGAPGFDAAAEYVRGVVASETDWALSQEAFRTAMYEQTEAPALSVAGVDLVEGQDFVQMSYSGAGGAWRFEDLPYAVPSGSGCAAGDYAAFPAGAAAVVSLDGAECEAWEQVLAAEEAGAVLAVVVAGRAASGPASSRLRKSPWFEDDPLVSIPALGVSAMVGDFAGAQGLLSSTGASTVEVVDTYNLVAEAPFGDPSRTVVVGAHLDGVPNTEGSNDNGSGVATALEIVLALARGPAPRNRVRVVFYSAEEVGLIGAYQYVRARQADGTIGNFSANVNIDMIASANAVRMIYDAAALDDSVPGKEAAVQMTEAFVAYFEGAGIAYDFRPMDGRSDYAPWVEAGIAAGGLSSGSNQIKTSAQRDVFGGLAGAQLCVAYHTPLDTLNDAVSVETLEIMARASAHVTELYANQ